MPLHVFEERYRRMVQDCLDGKSEFGVVLIDRGHEVGGGDVRREVGTVARILKVGILADGRFLLQTAGVRRVRVLGWLGESPYPRAEVEEWPDEEQSLATGDRVSEVLTRLRRVPRPRLGAGGAGGPGRPRGRRRPGLGQLPPGRPGADRPRGQLRPAGLPGPGRAAGSTGRPPDRRRARAPAPARERQRLSRLHRPQAGSCRAKGAIC